ncbi:MAG: Do family serine endopeptidase [Acidobacteria bacterium]|nr:Do family serine endopeptidase [Acidobacteriota bacterium]
MNRQTWLIWMNGLRKQKVLSVGLVMLTLCIGVLLGTLLTTGVSAAREQAAAPDATPLTIPPVHKLSNDFTKLAQMLEPSVVFISTEQTVKPQTTNRKRRAPQQQDEEEDGMQDPLRRFFGMPFDAQPMPRKREGSGSGFVLDKNGYIMTNLHVVDNADSIKVRLTGDKTDYKAKLIGSDPEIDIAIIKIEAGKALPPLKISNSDGVQVGDWAVAIGAPFGLETSVTAGIVSATGRDIAQQFQRFIQTDAAINPGNSGGPLVNINGEVIGINTMIATSSGGYQGIGFALPINSAVKSYNQIIRSGRVSRGSIGIRFPRDEASMTNTLKALGFKNGVIVESVKAEGPAEKAGIKPDDVLVALNGKPIKNGDDLVSQVSEMPSGTTVSVSLDRDGQKMEKKVTIEDREEVFKDDLASSRGRKEMVDPDNEKGTESSARFGIGIRPLTAEKRKEYQFEQQGGVEVTVVEDGSFAEEIGIRAKDIIVSINRMPVSSFEDVKKIQGKLKGGDAVAFKVMRPVAGNRRGEVQWAGTYLSGTLPAK